MGERYHLIDSLRGLAVVHMVLYHFCFDVFILQGFDSGWREIPWVHLWQQSICWTFLLVSGLCWHLGKRRWRGGLVLTLCGLLVTAVTVLVTPQAAIYFGVLSLLGAALWLTTLLAPALEKIPAGLGAAGSFFLFLLTRRVAYGVLSLGGITLCQLPDVLYQRGILTCLGFMGPGFVSSDYFPVFPWWFLYLTGYFLGHLVLRDPPELLRRNCPPLAFLGRHSLLVYLLHQPAALALSYGVAAVLR